MYAIRSYYDGSRWKGTCTATTSRRHRHSTRPWSYMSHRITSYNVCYTKLLRKRCFEKQGFKVIPVRTHFLQSLHPLNPSDALIPSFSVLDKWTLLFREWVGFVITSYSIHYTKLYEHIFPLRYCEGGVLKRAGHTEATVDLARLAGLSPAGIWEGSSTKSR